MSELTRARGEGWLGGTEEAGGGYAAEDVPDGDGPDAPVGLGEREEARVAEAIGSEAVCNATNKREESGG